MLSTLFYVIDAQRLRKVPCFTRFLAKIRFSCQNRGMKYTWLLFDVDGTLFNFELAEAKALEGAFRDLGLPYGPLTARHYHEINRQVWLDFEAGRVTAEALRTIRFSRLLEVMALEGDPAKISPCYLTHLAASSDLMPGAEETVRALAGEYRLGIVTNGLRDVQRPRLANSPIGSLFDVVAISEEIGAPKPEPRFFDWVMGQIGRPDPSLVLVIGDSLSSDIQGGNMAGMHTCWYNPFVHPGDPRFTATYEIRHLTELPALLYNSHQ